MSTMTAMYPNNRERRGHRNQIYTGKHLFLTALLVAAGLILVMPIRLSDAPPVSDPSGDPIALTDEMTIDDIPVPLCAAISILDDAEPVLPEDTEPVLPEEDSEPVLPEEDTEPVLPEETALPKVGESLDVPTDEKANNGFKSYMDYRTLTSKTSMQYAMQQDAWTDEQGLRRYGDYYMIALGTFYAKGCGETFRITLDSGETFDAITGDIKDDKHTDEKNQHRNGVIVEFIVDTKALSKTCRVMGDISHASGFSGRIESIERLNADI